jgi:hypothetical protein
MTRKLLFVVGIALLLTAAALIAFDHSAPASVSAQDGGEECPGGVCPEWILEAWGSSGHADAEAEAFNHWNEDDPQEVSASCAKCHSTSGHLDFLGADGTEAGVVDAGAPIGSTVECTACHNPVSVDKMTVVFPSGVEITGTDAGVRCMECHQGRESAVSVNASLEGLEEDTPSADIRFRNIHYFSAAASLYGSEVHGSYEYEGMAYQTKFEHVPGYDTCIGCHDPHTLQLKVDECAACHTNVAGPEDLTAIRMPGSMVDYDGDGSMDESLKDELDGMQAVLYIAMQAYATEVAGMPIIYDAGAYPYFFGDADGNGEVNGEEGSYASFTPRLLKAAYNYQAYQKDPGAFAHNGKYHAMVLYDSIASLNEMLPEPIDMSMMHRNPPGHFDGTAEAFRHWDEEGEVSGSCTKCHTSEGLPFMLEQGVTISFPPSTSLACSTCHEVENGFAFHVSDEVEFPSGAVLTFGEGVPSNLCINCHQGRESGPSLAAAIAATGAGDDDVAEGLRFRNVHYFAAGATLFGADANGIYQYEGKEYAGRFAHVPGFDNCAACHDVHALTVKVDACSTCHGDFGADPHNLRMMTGDLDGDGAEEGVAGEIDTLEEMLYAAIQAYAADTVGTPIVYSSARYPYFFIDANADGVADEGDTESHATWSPRLLRAAYNYQYVQKDPGAFAHNAKYVAQALYDTIEDLGGDVSGLTRP